MKLLINLLVALLSLLITLAVTEVYFRYFAISSEGMSVSLVSKRWFDTYWHPINKLGYRDEEFDPPKKGEKRVLIVLGDSFVAGHGINLPQDRFSNILERKLGAEWRVANVAMCGWSTRAEAKALRAFPAKPEALVVSYFINDIEEAANDFGKSPPGKVDPPPSFILPVVNNSYLANFVYWRLWQLGKRNDAGNEYYAYLKSIYEDSKIWQRHKEELFDIINYAHENKSVLLFSVLPSLKAIDQTAPFTSQVASFLKENGQEYVDFTPLLAGRQPKELVVNSYDAHANVALNAEMAEVLYKKLCSMIAC